MLPLPIATGYYTSEILTLAAQTCSNWIPIKPVAGALNPRALLDRKGLTSFATLSGEHRGAIDFNGVYVTLNGNTLSSITTDATVTTLGTVTGSGRVSIAKNDDFVVIVTNLGDCFYYNGSSVIQVTDTDYTDLNATTVTFVDGYFIFSSFDGSQFFLSGLNDPSSYSALDRSTAEERPDPIVSVFAYNNLLHVAGTETTEKYNNRGGGVSFPFQRITGASNSIGCYARYTPIEYGDAYAFIGGGKNEGAQVYLLSGGQPQAFSTPSIDTELQKFNDAELAQAFSFVWQQNGQSLIAFTINSDRVTDRTFCFNMTSGEWFELKSGTSAFRGKSVTKIYNKFLVGDSSNKVGYFDDVHTDYGDTIFREKASQPFLSADGDDYRLGRIEAWFEAGTGDAATSPQVMMDFSDDLGKTWSNETWRGIGKVGQYGVRAQWRKQGLVNRNRVYRFKASDPFKFNFMKLTAN